MNKPSSEIWFIWHLSLIFLPTYLFGLRITFLSLYVLHAFMIFAFFALAAFFSLALICFGDNVGLAFAAFLGFAFCLDFASCLGFEFVLLFCESFLTAGVLVTLLDTDVLFVFLVSESLSELPH